MPPTYLHFDRHYCTTDILTVSIQKEENTPYIVMYSHEIFLILYLKKHKYMVQYK